MKRQLLCLTLAAISSVLTCTSPADSQTPGIAPLAPISAETTQPPIQLIPGSKKGPKIVGAAIESTNMNHIKFGEYYIDWTAWMSEVATRWAKSSSGVATCKSRPSAQIIEFTCKKDGTITGIGILQGSGDFGCDIAQIQSLKNITPLPAFPKGSMRKEVSLLFIWEPAVDKNRTRCKVQINKPTLIIEGPSRTM